MSSQVKVTRDFEEGIYTVTIEVLPGGTLPIEVFLYEYTGVDPITTDGFYAVCTMENLSRPIYEAGLETFGVKFVRNDKVIKTFESEENATSFETSVISRIEYLDAELEGNGTYTKTYTIGT